MKILNGFLEREMLRGISEDTLKRKRKELERFLDHTPEYRKTESSDIAEYIKNTGKELSPRLVNRKLTYLRQFFEYLLSEGEVLLNPVLELDRLKEEDDKHSGVFTELEIIVKGYANSAGLEKNVTSHTFRHSCAGHMLKGAQTYAMCRSS